MKGCCRGGIINPSNCHKIGKYMTHRTVLSLLLSATILLITLPRCYGQDTTASGHQSEVSSNIPALEEFHSVIAQVWHTAWPKKDVAMLVELLPEIDRLSEPVFKAELPGILREKKSAWNKGIEELQKAISSYREATSPVDTQKLLDAAEKLHAKYEQLVRSVRPVLPEIEQFHSTLYLLYHYYLPAYDIKKIRQSVEELAGKMAALDSAKLPKRFEKRSEKFLNARKSLSASMKTLQATVNSGDKESITAGIETMHSDYQALEKVFD